ncbi:MAG: hypothetical protein CMD88_02800 [Gammaproteobacteria bacterium]|nr:hypothetical protein [Gammaproteobacteria bacterium]
MYRFLIVCSIAFFISSCSSSAPKIILSGDKLMCLSETKDSCQKLIEKSCSPSSYKVIREELESNIFEDDRYILTYKCK